MAAVRTRKTVRSAAAKAPARRTKSTPRSSLAAFPLRTAFVVVGVVGLAALGIALLGPRRIRDEFIRPMAEVTYAPVAARCEKWLPPASRNGSNGSADNALGT
jgi:hypothetical protein